MAQIGIQTSSGIANFGGNSPETQVSTLPTASSSYEGKILQYIGNTTQDYTHGYFYECVATGSTEGVGFQLLTSEPYYVPQFTTIPSSQELLNYQYIQYMGATTNSYTHGAIYEIVRNSTDDGQGNVDEWGEIGDEVDISGATVVTSVPANPSVGDLIKYMGSNTADYEEGRFYQAATVMIDTYAWVQKNIQPNDGAGHIIVDADGNELPQRSKMKFKDFIIEDDSENDLTIITGKRPHTIFAVHYSENNSSPDSCNYPEGYDNYGWTPFSMNLSTGVPNYGSWDPNGENASLVKFIFPRSCMLNYDGTVAYYLNENDETKKADGTVSDVANTSFGGNAMMEWGQDGKKLYWKLLLDADNKGFTFIVADGAVDKDGNPDPDMIPWNHYDCNGNIAPHWYTAKYFGSSVSSKMRSISGQSNYVNNNDAAETTLARANNLTSNIIWDKEVYADWTFIGLMCVLLGKSMNTQAKFGYGRCSSSNSSAIGQGTMNGKGMFYGRSDQTSGVKVFGMENVWGNLWRRIRGLVNVSGTVKVKMTHGTQDGSSASDYNQTGSGYLTVGSIGGTNGGYISAMNITKFGLTPKTISGSDSTYYTDGGWFNNSQTNVAFVGGRWYFSLRVGAFCCFLYRAVSHADADVGAALSCKPLA